MKVLFMNRNSGAGVEFEGNIFIEILKRIVGIDYIDIYQTQCRQKLASFNFSPYDLIITNDLNFDEQYNNVLNIGTPVINISFSGGGGNSEIIDLIYDLNFYYTINYDNEINNYISLNFISGNIWKSYKKWENRSDQILYIARLHPNKIIPEFIEILRKDNRTIDFYGPISDNEYYENNKDVIKYKGFVNHKELVDIYNNYKYLYLFSITECLSMTLREALLCGTVPIVYDNCNYTEPLNGYIVKFTDFPIDNLFSDYSYMSKLIFSKMDFLKRKFSFERLILDFLMPLRGLLLKDLKFNKNHINKVNYVNGQNEDRMKYEDDAINWNNINL